VAAVAADAGCRAAWIPTVSESTFSPDVCSVSGYFRKKFAFKGSLSNDNKIDVTVTGYESMAQPYTADYDRSVGVSLGYENGLAGDLVNGGADGGANPLGLIGYRYCQCLAVAVHGCDPTHLVADLNSAATLTILARNGDLGSVFGNVDKTHDDADEWLALAPSFLQAYSLSGEVAHVNSDVEAAALQALADSLNKKLDNCAVVAVTTNE